MSKYILYFQDKKLRWLSKNLPNVYKFIDLFDRICVGLLRFMTGSKSAKGINQCFRPEKLLILYEYEGCPFCKKVRENLSILDINYIVYPCPRTTLKASGQLGNSRFRPIVKQKGGILKFPYLEDPNTGISLYESDQIIKHLWGTYGTNAKPTLAYKLANLSLYQSFSLFLTIYFRPCLDMGFLATQSKQPKELLELWGTEPSPPVKLVRETLSSLEIPYIMNVIPYGSKEKRKEFAKKHANSISSTRKSLGLIQIPYLEDPNTGISLFESTDIVKYLKNTYQISDNITESWLDYGTES